jgi:sugar/nucleoside kinase (ribokinase family)
VIAVLGQCVEDVVRAPGRPVVHRLGGSPLFAAQALWREGGPAVVGTRGGTPALRAPLIEVGLPVVVGPAATTFRSLLELHEDGSRGHVVDSLGEPFTPADVDGWLAPALEGARAAVCGAQWCDDFAPPVLAALRAGGRRVYLDAQGPARAGLGPVEPRGPLDPGVAANVDVLKASDEEADALFGGVDPVAAERSGIPVVVVTHGHQGATVLTGGRGARVAVEPVHLADAVGAGDSFLALYALAELRGADPVHAASVACEGVAAILRARLAG